MGRIRTDDLAWTEPPEKVGVRYKVVTQGNRQVRLVEFSDGFHEDEWCCRGHIGFVLSGHLEVEYTDRVEQLAAGDILMIKAGEPDKHRARALQGPALLFLVEDI